MSFQRGFSKKEEVKEANKIRDKHVGSQLAVHKFKVAILNLDLDYNLSILCLGFALFLDYSAHFTQQYA